MGKALHSTFLCVLAVLFHNTAFGAPVAPSGSTQSSSAEPAPFPAKSDQWNKCLDKFRKCLEAQSDSQVCLKRLVRSTRGNVNQMLSSCSRTDRVLAPWVPTSHGQALQTRLPLAAPASGELHFLVFASSQSQIKTASAEPTVISENALVTPLMSGVWLVTQPQKKWPEPVDLVAAFPEQRAGAEMAVLAPLSSDFTTCFKVTAVGDKSAQHGERQVCGNFTDVLGADMIETCKPRAKTPSTTAVSSISDSSELIVTPQACSCYYRYSCAPVPEVDMVALATLSTDGAQLPTPTHVSIERVASWQTWDNGASPCVITLTTDKHGNLKSETGSQGQRCRFDFKIISPREVDIVANPYYVPYVRSVKIYSPKGNTILSYNADAATAEALIENC